MWRKSWFPPFHRTPINITVCKCLWHNFDFTALHLMPLTVPCLSACKMPEMGKSSSSTEKPTSDSDTENRRSIAMGKHAAKCTRRFHPMTFARFDLIWHQRRWRWNRIVGGISIWRWLNMCVLMLLRRFAHLAYDINKAYRTREIKKSLLFEEHLEQKFRSFLTFNVCVCAYGLKQERAKSFRMPTTTTPTRS